MTTTPAPALPEGFPTPHMVRTPDSAPRNSYDKVREYEWTFLFGPEADDFDPDRTPNAVRLTIEHSGRRKAFQARAKVIHLSRNMVSESFSFRRDALPEDATLALPAPAPRYSRKALDQYAAAVVAALDPETFGAGSKVAELFARIRAEQAATV